MAVFATAADVQATFEEEIDNDSYERVELLLADAQLRVSEALGVALEEWVAEGSSTRLDTLRSVLVEMVQRVLRSPGAIVSEAEQGYSYTVDRAAAGLLMRVTPDQLSRLRGRGLNQGRYGVSRYTVPSWSPRAAGLYESGGYDVAYPAYRTER